MSKENWNRPIKVSFIGSGEDKQGLIDLANLLNSDNHEFLPYQDDVERLWDDYHALILPSRFEGSPLVLLEAMSLGRTSIVSTAGGMPELISDGETGFIGQANETEFEYAMERAWEARDRWPEIGVTAHQKITTILPESPEQVFAEKVHQSIHEKNETLTVIIPTYNRSKILK
ncbi:MAG: glycosyltransferase [Bacteroidia bacterium]